MQCIEDFEDDASVKTRIMSMKKFRNITNVCGHSGDRYAAFQRDGRAEKRCEPFKAEASYHWSVRSYSARASAGFSLKRPGHFSLPEEFLQQQLLLKLGHELFCFLK